MFKEKKNSLTLILDNYDSFTYNLFQYVAELGGNPVVHRNDEITIEEIHKLKPTHIIISPGPGTPEKKKDIGICDEVIKHFSGVIPILGVCLGHQIIGHIFGGKIVRAPQIMHGKTSKIRLNKSEIFAGLPGEIEAMRYHSLIVDNPPEELEVIAETDNLIMGLKHRFHKTFGIQFHPESIGTKHGKTILKNFLNL